MAILKRVQRAGKPEGLVGINYANPLTRSLVFAGPVGQNIDRSAASNLGRATPLSSSSVVTTQFGRARDNNGTTNGGIRWSGKKTLLSSTRAITVIAYANPASGSIVRLWSQGVAPDTGQMASLAVNSTQVGNTSSGKFAMFAITSWPTGTGATTSATSYVDGTYHWFGGTLIPSTSTALYYDGRSVAITSEATSTPTSWASGTQETACWGNHGDTTGIDGTGIVCFTWDRALSASEHLAVTKNPWQLFAPSAAQQLAVDLASGSGTTILVPTGPWR